MRLDPCSRNRIIGCGSRLSLPQSRISKHIRSNFHLCTGCWFVLPTGCFGNSIARPKHCWLCSICGPSPAGYFGTGNVWECGEGARRDRQGGWGGRRSAHSAAGRLPSLIGSWALVAYPSIHQNVQRAYMWLVILGRTNRTLSLCPFIRATIYQCWCILRNSIQSSLLKTHFLSNLRLRNYIFSPVGPLVESKP